MDPHPQRSLGRKWQDVYLDGPLQSIDFRGFLSREMAADAAISPWIKNVGND